MDVTEVTSGLSVAGQDAPAMLVPTLDGPPITLRITGSGLFRRKDERDRDEDCDVDENDWEINAQRRYHWNPIADFISHTYLDDRRAHRVFIDDSIALQPSGNGTFSNTELTMTLDPKGIPDYQIGGMHRLTVVQGRNWVRIPIRFGKGQPPRSLAPQIQAIRVLRVDDEPERTLIEIIGRNLPISFLNTYATVDAQRAYAHGSFATSADSLGFIHVPTSAVTTTAGPHRLFVATPFGVTFGQF